MSLLDTIKDVGTIGAGYALGGVPGGAAAAAFVGSQNRNQANADIAASNNAWSAEQYATRYQTQVKDLEAAGLNPMLAYMQSPGQAPVAQSYQFDAPYSAAAEAYNSSKGTSGAYERDIASASQARSNARLIDTTVGKVKAEIGKIGQETTNLVTDEKRLRYLIENLAESSALMAQQHQNETVRENLLRETVRQLRNENIITEFDIKAIRETGMIGRIAREVKPVSDITTDVLDSFKLWKGKNIRENGTTYDRHGNPSGGFSRQRSER